MTLRGMVFIALRFYAVSLLALVIPILPTLIAFLSVESAPAGVWMGLSVPLAYFVMAVLLWFAAGRLASGIAREFNPAVQFQMTLEDAFTFAFVFLGLYFVLSTAASTVIQLLNLVGMMETEPEGSAAQTRVAHEFYRLGITLVIGLACVFCSRAWARKLASAD
jgi:D-alanyl-lipoteichoic acid acyltransferase DltB (MBOAT superfamily)